MKIKITRALSAGLLLALLIFQSCSKDKDVSKGAFQTGVFVANEGGFGSSNGDVTYYNSSSALLEQNIYKSVNGSFAGNVLQSISFDGDAGYLVINAGNKVEIIDGNTFKSTGTLSDGTMINPRYVQVINGKAYVSAWGAFSGTYLTSSAVFVFDLSSGALVTSIPTDVGAENLLYDGHHLFAANNNFGGSNTITVIDPSTNKSVKTITVHDGPSGMVLDANNKLWVITTGPDAALMRINPATFAKEDSLIIDRFANGDLAISPDKKSLIYSSGFGAASVYKVATDATAGPNAPWFEVTNMTTMYSLGVDPKSGEVYLGDALDYASAGTVYVYSADGTFKNTFTAGISPGQFIFK